MSSEVVFENPLDEIAAKPAPKPQLAAGWTSDADLAYYGTHERDHSVTWLVRRTEKQRDRVRELGLNEVKDYETSSILDLGIPTTSWCFVFSMTNTEQGDTDEKAEPGCRKIPQDAWQFCHMLWKYDFHIQHTFSTLGDELHILVGLPYKVLLQEAIAVKLKMRFSATLGTAEFQESLLTRYRLGRDKTVFNSGAKQGLTMFRMRRLAHVYPDVLVSFGVDISKTKFRERIFDQVHSKKAVRALALYEMFVAFGAYRPHSLVLFGPTVHRVAQTVLANPYLVVLPPGSEEVEGEGIVQKVDQYHVNWADVEKCLLILETWELGQGNDEQFVGNLSTYLPLHHKLSREYLTEVWGNYGLLFKCKVVVKQQEFDGKIAYHDPDNVPTGQFGPLYQPIDEIRDYFGEEVAIYFAWLGCYTSSLTYPAILGVLILLVQFIWYDGQIDENIWTIPYTIFFAGWSIEFLCRWKRREHELQFLWGSEGYEAHERPLANFKGKFVVNAETGQEDYVYTETRKRNLIISASWMISLACIYFTICCATLATFIKSLGCSGEACDGVGLVEKHKWKVLSSVSNLLIITIFGVVYQTIAGALTEWENHRTRSEFSDATISKNFLFQFINNYFVLFYIAYLRPFTSDIFAPLAAIIGVDISTDGSSSGGGADINRQVGVSALGELQFQLMIVFTGKTIGARLTEILKPKIIYFINETKILMSLKKQMLSGQMFAQGIVGRLVPSTAGEDQFADTATSPHNNLSKKDQMGWLEEHIKEDDVADENTSQYEAVDDEYAHDADEYANDVGNKDVGNKMLRSALRQQAASDSMVEDEILMFSFDNMFDEFNEMVIQYGYLALFAPAFSLAPLLAMVNNVIEIRIDANKFCNVFRRPQWRPCEDIGAWYGVLNVIGFAAVVTNCTMIAFVGPQFAEKGTDEEDGIWARILSVRLWAYAVLLEHGVMLLRVFILKLEPQVPSWLDDAKKIADFRVGQWKTATKLMKKQGYTMDQIHAEIHLADGAEAGSPRANSPRQKNMIVKESKK
eukprot:SAG31_NODE_2409_length_5754_cov_2.321485_2_plen_1028_part_00